MEDDDSGASEATRRLQWVPAALAILVLPVIALVILGVLGTFNGSSEDDRAAQGPVRSDTTRALTARERCVVDLAGIVRSALASSSTDEQVFDGILIVYGSEDIRTHFLIRQYGIWASDVRAYGAERAEQTFGAELDRFCEQEGPGLYDDSSS